MKDKRGQTWETLIPWLIAIAILVVIGVFAFLLKDQLIAFAGKIKNLFRG